MAEFIVATAKSLLPKFGQSLAGAAGKWLLKKGLGALTDGSETDKIRKDIADLVDQVKDVKAAVDSLSNQLADALLQLRSDRLKASLTKINTHWDTIADILLTAVDLPKDLSTKERAIRLKNLQARLVDRLQECANEVPGILDAIDSFLSETGGDGFVRQVAQQALNGSTDFLAYYGKTKTLILGYWVVVVKGISLLQMAADSPDAKFEEGAKTLERQRTKLLQQEEVFIDTIGKNTIRLAELVLADPYNDLDIGFTDNKGHTFTPAPGSEHVPPRKGEPNVEWWDCGTWGRGLSLRPVHPSTLKTSFDVNGKYTVHLRADRFDKPYLIFSASRYQAVAVQDSDLSQWYIRPIAPGSDRYAIQYNSNYKRKDYHGTYLRVPHGSWAWDGLCRQDKWDDKDDRLLFQITPPPKEIYAPAQA